MMPTPDEKHDDRETEAELKDMIEMAALAEAFALLSGHDDAARHLDTLVSDLKSELAERDAGVAVEEDRNG